jgi:3,4-dihydroxy 2-butanone 4-phosphate synthase/GTP cyclohydrolase II
MSDPSTTPGISTIEEAVAAIKAGRPVIVADNEDRENEGDVILSAELATPETIAWTVQRSSGLLCAPMTNEIADQLELPMMVEANEDVRGTAYTVTVDATHGVTTGISASDRATTVKALANLNAAPGDVRRPGHILPLRAVDGGVRARDGHTEASVELMRLAGLRPVAVIAEIVADDGEMMRLPELLELGSRENVPVITIERLIAYLNEHSPAQPVADAQLHRSVSLRANTLLPTEHGEFRALAYRDRRIGVDHIALVAPTPEGALPGAEALVRVHSECITGEAFGSLKCECGPQLDAALSLVNERGGIVIYLRGHAARRRPRLLGRGRDPGRPRRGPRSAAHQQPRQGGAAAGPRHRDHRARAAARRSDRAEHRLPLGQARSHGSPTARRRARRLTLPTRDSACRAAAAERPPLKEQPS